jgi:hypothetical protein
MPQIRCVNKNFTVQFYLISGPDARRLRQQPPPLAQKKTQNWLVK